MNTVISQATLLDSFQLPLYIERETLIRKLLNKLLNDHFVVVIGNQGVGKSTLVDVGLRSEISTGNVMGDSDSKWKMVWTNPLANPIRNLALDLARPGALKEKGQVNIDDYLKIEEQLRQGGAGLIKVYEDAVAAAGEPFNLLLAVNQEQDLYRYHEFIPKIGQEGDDILFLDLILTTAYEHLPIYIVFITDTENLGHFTRYRGMPEAINNYRFTVPSMSLSQITQWLKGIDNTKPESKFLAKLFQGLALIDRNNDAHVLYKLNHCLQYTQLLWQEQNATLPLDEDTLLATYNTISRQDYYIDDTGKLQVRPRYGIIEALNHHLERLFNTLPEKAEDPDRMKLIASFMFKALTHESGDDVLLPRPAFVNELIELSDRVGIDKVTLDDLQLIINHFNDVQGGTPTKHVFLDVLGTDEEKLTNKSIVDINNAAILQNWLQMKAWAEEEMLHANIYKSIIRDAKSYASRIALSEQIQEVAEQSDGTNSSLNKLVNQIKQLPSNWLPWKTEPETPVVEEELLYTGASLSGAIDWRDSGFPNETWAERYLATEPGGFPNDFLQRIRQERRISAGRPLTQLGVALWFVNKSERFSNLAKEKEEALRKHKLKWARRVNTFIFGLILIAIVTIIWALWQRSVAKEAQKKLGLVEYVETLDYYNVLAHPTTGDDFRAVYDLQQQVIIQDSIDSHGKVLSFLQEKQLLELANDPQHLKVNRSALSLIGELLDYLSKKKNNDQVLKSPYCAPSLDSLLHLCQLLYKVAPDSYPAEALRDPYLYQALEAHIDVLAQGKEHRLAMDVINWIDTADKATINAIAANPLDPMELAYGDANGAVMIVFDNPTLQGPTEAYKLSPTLDAPITDLIFSKDGRHLFAATADRRIHRYDGMDKNGSHQLNNLIRLREKAIYLKPVSIGSNDLLFIGTETSMYLYHLTRRRIEASYEIAERYDFSRITQFQVLPDDGQVVVGGKDHTLVFSLYPRGRFSARFGLTPIRIIHPQVCITSVAAESSIDGQNYLALGTETGSLWLIKDFKTILDGSQTEIALASYNFDEYPTHRASINTIAFQKENSQLVTVGADGNLQFWDLRDMANGGAHIRINNQLNNVQDVCYLNANELIVADLLELTVWRTNSYAQWQYLEQLVSQESDCSHAKE